MYFLHFLSDRGSRDKVADLTVARIQDEGPPAIQAIDLAVIADGIVHQGMAEDLDDARDAVLLVAMLVLVGPDHASVGVPAAPVVRDVPERRHKGFAAKLFVEQPGGQFLRPEVGPMPPQPLPTDAGVREEETLPGGLRLPSQAEQRPVRGEETGVPFPVHVVIAAAAQVRVEVMQVVVAPE